MPLFALANAGITISGSFLARRLHLRRSRSGILIGYVLGKPVGTVGAAWLLTQAQPGHDCARRSAGPRSTGAGTIAGIGFTVALLIASLAFHGTQLTEAKLGILSAALVASALTWIIFRLTALLPTRLAGARADRHRRDRSSTSQCRSTSAVTTSAARPRHR